MKVVFLDIDGVCNSEETLRKSGGGIVGIDPYLAFLVGKIGLYTDAKFVLSSSWRHSEDGRKEVREKVCNFIDVTPIGWYHKELDHHSMRGEEIKKWLDDHPEVERYAIIDDDSDILPEQLPNFFKTTWKKGITEEIMQKVIDHLNAPL